MLIYAAKRLIVIPISVFVVVSLASLLTELLPSNPALTILGDSASPDQVAMVNEQLGVDKPFLERYGSYWGRVLHGDLGTSFFSHQSVRDEIFQFLPNTIELIVLSLVVALVVGLIVGGLGAYFRNRLPDKASKTLTAVLQSTPDFLLALMLIYFVFYLARIVPAPIGRLDVATTQPPQRTGFLFLDSLLAGDMTAFGNAAGHAILPVAALGIAYAAYFAKTTRSAMGRALSAPQVEFARACGLPEWRVVHYAFLAGRTPVLTYVAILFGSLLGGAAILETIFNWRGLGQWGLQGVLRLDVPVIQGFVMVCGLLTLLIFVALDIIVLALDPRISYD
ncbi:ABC transporter permease [Dactylosporangium salmoneum]|uniref:ABC transporter permease n=1 Tax=Dactylosporangium salmoneum TaxID=53361 RepID=A0ABP5TF65_9ACTN